MVQRVERHLTKYPPYWRLTEFELAPLSGSLASLLADSYLQSGLRASLLSDSYLLSGLRICGHHQVVQDQVEVGLQGDMLCSSCSACPTPLVSGWGPLLAVQGLQCCQQGSRVYVCIN